MESLKKSATINEVNSEEEPETPILIESNTALKSSAKKFDLPVDDDLGDSLNQRVKSPTPEGQKAAEVPSPISASELAAKHRPKTQI